jgi:phage terminase small subunit
MVLRKQWQKFADEYLKCWDQTEAAILAGYSERSAYNQGHRLMKKDEIQAYIAERLEELKLGADEVLLRLGEQARADYARYLTLRNGVPVFDFAACKRDGKLHLIKKIKYKDGLPAEIEFYDAQTALIKLGQHHNLFDDDQNVKLQVEVQPISFIRVGKRQPQEGDGESSSGSTASD